jgi:hypothetical protein
MPLFPQPSLTDSAFHPTTSGPALAPIADGRDSVPVSAQSTRLNEAVPPRERAGRHSGSAQSAPAMATPTGGWIVARNVELSAAAPVKTVGQSCSAKAPPDLLGAWAVCSGEVLPSRPG